MFSILLLVTGAVSARNLNFDDLYVKPDLNLGRLIQANYGFRQPDFEIFENRRHFDDKRHNDEIGPVRSTDSHNANLSDNSEINVDRARSRRKQSESKINQNEPKSDSSNDRRDANDMKFNRKSEATSKTTDDHNYGNFHFDVSTNRDSESLPKPSHQNSERGNVQSDQKSNGPTESKSSAIEGKNNSTKVPDTVDLDDRAAFSGDQCATGMARVKGVCVNRD